MSIIFQNPGLIDIFGVTTFGASAKECENPVGFFGTGLKYAIAVILRHKGKITLWRGLERFDFATQEIESRGKSFEVITMNGEPLSFTTELGKTWEMWQAFRELFCNAKDESGECRQLPRELVGPCEGATVVSVECREMEDAYSQIGKIILDAPVLYETPELRICAGSSNFIFYRGVRVGSFNNPTFFTYDIRQSTMLSEDRSLKENYTAAYLIAKTIQACTDAKLIEDAITTGESFWEDGCEFARHYTTSPQFMEVLRRVKNDLTRPLNRFAMRIRLDEDLDGLQAGISDLDDRQLFMVEKSIAFLAKMGFAVDEYPIVITDQLGGSIMGRAHKGRIYLSTIPFDKGIKQVVATLFEEWVHLKYGVFDETRQMQDILMEKMIEQAEFRFKEFL